MSIRRGAQSVTLIGFFMMTALWAQAPVFNTLYSFAGVGDGSFPEAGLAINSSGVLFGTTFNGGTGGWGTVFQLIPATGGTFTQKTLYSFTGGADGADPLASVIIGNGNVLYGTTYQGGDFGFGTVFELIPGAGAFTEQTLYSFTGGADGANPMGSLVKNANGVIFGTTSEGGASGWGTVFQLIPAAGGTFTEKTLYSFTGGADGGNPLAGLLVSSSNSVYGTTYAGGASGSGTVFQLAPGAGGTWTETVLYSFTGGADGGGPEAGLTANSSGTFYGSTFFGGSLGSNCLLGGYPAGCGTVFQLTPVSPGVWNQQTIYTFAGGGDGSHPYQKVALSSNGSLFGTTFTDGAALNTCFPGSFTGCGTLFMLKPPVPPATLWTKTNLHTFQGSDGGGPNGVIINPNGVLFGTTFVGGTSGGFGTVFQWKP